MKFEFGEKVRVKATLIRMHGPGNTRYWQKYEDTDFEAIFLGNRTLQSGRIKNVIEDFDQSVTYFQPSEYHPAALVCRKGFNPIKVFLEHIEPICCNQVDSDGGVCNLKVDHKEDHNYV